MLVLAFWATTALAVPSSNLWVGEWVSDLPQIGKIAIELRAPTTYHGSCKLFWLFRELSGRWEVEGDSVTLSVSSGTVPSTKENPTQLRLQRNGDGTLGFVAFGVITPERLKVFGTPKFLSAPRGTLYDLASYLRPNSQYKRFSSGGQLQPLPVQFPTEFMDISVLLCRGLDHDLLALLKHPNLSSAVLGQITQDALDPKTGNRGALHGLPPLLAAHPNTAKGDLQRLFDLPYSYDRRSPLIWRAAALNPSAPASYRQIYLDRIKSGEWRVRVWVARDKEAPRDAWEVAIAPREGEVLQQFVRNPNAPADMLNEIADIKGADTAALAANPATPPELLEGFSEGTNSSVLQALLRNRACPSSAVNRALQTLATSKSAMARQLACMDTRLDKAMFSSLMRDQNLQVRGMLAMNTNAPFEILMSMANDPYESVSSRARDNLTARFPKEVAGIKAGWKPLSSLKPYGDLSAEFADVVKHGDESRMRELLAIASDEDTRIPVRTIVDSMLQYNFDRLSGILLEVVQREGGSARNAIFGSQFLKPEILVWADQLALTDSNSASFVLETIWRSGNSNLLSTLLETQAGRRMSDDGRARALFKATELRSLELMEILLVKGAEPERIVHQAQVPLYETNGSPMKVVNLGAVDLAARAYFISGLKRLDQTGKYRGLIADFEKEFPSTRNSPYVGLWDNGRDGFGTSRFKLDPDGTGMFGASIYGGPAVWKSTASGVELFLILQNGINREMKIVMTPNENKNELVWKKEKGESERYRKTEKKP